MYEAYRARVKKILAKLPKSITVHYTDDTGKKHCVQDDDFIMKLISAHREGRTGIVKEVDPVDLMALEARSRLYSILLMHDGYKPAYSVIIRDPETGQNRELTEGEEEEMNQTLDAMTETERANYWRQQEALFFEHFGRKKGEEE